ncbi:hypothetical protein FDP41_006545 [Naegleria fowleri]|uniref:Uncharacterized protein n=1 Tax=Naegleria fowleri TaxID=5763 RepID=A0A6A5B867_NAEFO|nr:uncharacterized protein FDP41_006545 [Naegleria fowleri]KAF0974513.1 hypothetical protein FDP41_006545 [Naegleria fowleri]CAG4712023.1 unnamed protein product [Naegleria fowleri]
MAQPSISTSSKLSETMTTPKRENSQSIPKRIISDLEKIEPRYFRTRSGSFDISSFKHHLKSDFKHFQKKDLSSREFFIYGIILAVIPFFILIFFMLTYLCYLSPRLCPVIHVNTSFTSQENNTFIESLLWLISWWFYEDIYFKFLIPMAIPVVVLFIYFNWRSFQEFKYN